VEVTSSAETAGSSDLYRKKGAPYQFENLKIQSGILPQPAKT
jgi:hypothetical protein